tara:strand:+ start:14939 stop:17308 length:2370 start_codon:yes stop_codon:yes gene_type:complete
MHNALRAHENPALDVAICLARQNGLPLLVYHGLSEDYACASDRHHAFILQGARDVQRQLTDRGISACFHVQRAGNRGPHLRSLVRDAAVLITEEMPTQPISGWLERLVQITDTPIACVDSSCVVPTQLVDGTFTRAFQFRDATKSLYTQRIENAYPEQVVDCEIYDGPLPFQPVDLQDQCLAKLISQCRIDHAVAPVAETTGGSRAGYQRWNRFCQDGLDHYEHRRNDAAIRGGTSRMSAYLHYGMVSPFRIAREAFARNATKFLDELLIWRELSFHFCFHHTDLLDSVEALPDWARETLEQHANDARPENLSWETMARGRTGQALWDACQRSLLKHGELHNNVRMTWGKALIEWTRCPGLALHWVRDLNHRYALDARDPCSYGGILWCFGQFDRPFHPEQEVWGKVRKRPVDAHQERINMKRFETIVDRPIAADLPRVAIIGAGVGGLMAARTLIDHGLEVQVFEKSRGVGGRLATRRIDQDQGFDHGAQYLTAKDCRFGKYVKSWIQDGIVAPWMGRIVELSTGGRIVSDKTDTPRYVGTPSMNQIAKHLATGVPTRRETAIASIRGGASAAWDLIDQDDQVVGSYDVVICNAPPAQTLALIDGHCSFAAQVAEIEMRPCWSAMLTTNAINGIDFDAAFINDSPLSWIARDNSKPGRSDGSRQDTRWRWMLHAEAEWSKEHIEDDDKAIRTEMVAALEHAIGQPVNPIGDVITHRWRHAIPANPIDQECLWDATAGIGVCGDWCGGPRIEGAFLSGVSVAGTILRHYTIDRPPYLEPKKQSQPSLLG